MLTIDPSTVVNAVRDVAAEYPFTVYKRGSGDNCSLLRGKLHGDEHPDEPGCLMGQALRRLGLKREDLEYLDGYGAIGESGTPWEDLFDARVEHSMEIQWLQEVQSCQDSGDPWGEAVRLGDIGRPLI